MLSFFLKLRGALGRHALLAYGLAFATFVAALATRFAIAGHLPPGYPFLTFFPAVIITAFVSGTRPGALCALLSGLAAWYYFIPPSDSFTLDSNGAVGMGFYVFIVVIDILIIDAMVRATERLDAERNLSAGLVERQRTMFAELQHRVANNLAIVSGLLMMQKRRVVAEPARAGEVFDDAVQRLEIMARLHRKLYDPAVVDLPTEAYLRDLLADLVSGSAAGAVSVDVKADDVRFDLPRLTALSLFVTEVATNALKHGIRAAEGGTISLRLTCAPDRSCELVMHDSGPGMPATPTAASQGSLGLKIVRGLANQLGGEVELPSAGRSTVRLRFAAA